MNKRWKQPAEKLPTYEEVLQQANLPADEQHPGFVDDSILDEDDEFLVKVHEFERSKQETNPSLVGLLIYFRFSL